MSILLAFAATAVFADWPTYHGQADLKGMSEATLPVKPELLWRYNAGAAVYNTPVSDGERVFFTAEKGRVVALDLNGSKVWEKRCTRTSDAGDEMPARFEAPLACGGGFVFAGTTHGTLYALDAGTGKEQWRYEMAGIIIGSPNLIKPHKAQKMQNVVLLDQSEGALHCLDIKTGKRVWKTEGVERCDGAPGVGDERIVFGSCLAALHVYDMNGKPLRTIAAGGDGQIAGGVAVDGRRAFAGTRDGRLICADLEAGDMVWSSDESQDQTFSTPAVAVKSVLYSSDDGFVYAVNRKDGALQWTFDTGGSPSSPVVAEGSVVVSADGVLYVLGLAGGRKLWSKEVSDEITSPAIIGGRVVVGADDGTVSAFGIKE
jgi:outer membrane protein assembly factor BamB